MNRRSLLAGGMGWAGIGLVSAQVQVATPESLQDAPWLSGSSAMHDVPDDAKAEPGTIQVVRISPVLYEEFAAILIHNNTNRARMINGVRGNLSTDTLPGFDKEVAAYMIPNIILPPNEYWIGRLIVPTSIAVETPLTFESEVRLQTELPSQGDTWTLLTTIGPENDFALPETGEPWPIRYRNDAPYSAGQYASFQQVFFDELGEICGFISDSVRYDDSGEAEFIMRLTSDPRASTGGAPLGIASNRWLAQWSHWPTWTAFEGFDVGE